jgi:hypothetical protein
MFAKRKKSPFRGPTLNPAFFSASSLPAAFGSPAVVTARHREGSDGRMNLGLKDFMGKRGGSGKRKSQIIEEEEDEGDQDGQGNGHIDGRALGEEEEEIEEVDAFQAIQLNKGERVQSITIWNDAVEDAETEEAIDDDHDENNETTRKEGVLM